MLEALHHALIDTAKILPFLFLTDLVLEYIEHKAAEKIINYCAGFAVLGHMVTTPST